MKKNLPAVAAPIVFSIVLSACGGGGSSGGGSGSTTSPTTPTELEGVWIAATDGNISGSSCGLTVSGDRGERFTVSFTMNRYTFKAESCIILTGNKGSYIQNDSASGTFTIGDITKESSNPAERMRALDLISDKPVYTSYSLAANKLHVALPFQGYDGSTRDKRAFQIATFYDPVSKTLIENPTYLKQ